MYELYEEPEFILVDTIKDWTTKQFQKGKEYELCSKIEKDVVEPIGITLLKTKNNSIKVTIELDGSAKYWSFLFSLPSYILAMKDAVSITEHTEIFDWDIEEPNHMFINYGFTTSEFTSASEILNKVEQLKLDVRNKTIRILVEQANGLL